MALHRYDRNGDHYFSIVSLLESVTYSMLLLSLLLSLSVTTTDNFGVEAFLRPTTKTHFQHRHRHPLQLRVTAGDAATTDGTNRWFKGHRLSFLLPSSHQQDQKQQQQQKRINRFLQPQQQPKQIVDAAILKDNNKNNKRRNRIRTYIMISSFLSLLLPFLFSQPALAASSAASSVAATETATAIAAAASTRNLVAETSLLCSPVSVSTEIKLTFRLLYAAVLGSLVGKERSTTHRHSAGVRTMALVSMGAATFTIVSMFGFLNFITIPGMNNKYDPGRMASSIVSGVGFVGAGVITTTSAASRIGRNGTAASVSNSHQRIVHGLATATAIWISAAVGISCGIGMFYVATVAAVGTIGTLRIGHIGENRKPKQQQERHATNTTLGKDPKKNDDNHSDRIDNKSNRKEIINIDGIPSLLVSSQRIDSNIMVNKTTTMMPAHTPEFKSLFVGNGNNNNTENTFICASAVEKKGGRRKTIAKKNNNIGGKYIDAEKSTATNKHRRQSSTDTTTNDDYDEFVIKRDVDKFLGP